MASTPPSIAAKHGHATSWKYKRHVIELALFAVLVLALAGVASMLTYWPGTGKCILCWSTLSAAR
jgi:hypothetical protein